MNKREVLEKYYDPANDEVIGSGVLNIDQALTALNKLEKEKMLEMVGEDAQYIISNSDEGYNQAKAEIRERINL